MYNENYVTKTYNRKPSWSPLMDFSHELDRALEVFSSSQLGKIQAAQKWYPACDVTEHDNHFYLILEMAGIPKDQIQIEVIEDKLVVTGERKKEKEKGMLYSERLYGKFHRTFDLPTGLDLDKIEADYQDGVLSILIPKAETAKPRKIKIGTGGTVNSFFGKFIASQTETPINASS
jgi:HSP20 family protein